jgi:hypothetical protein
MKTFLSIPLILFTLLSFAQNTATDSSATCIAYWQKGEGKVFQITRSKEGIVAGKTSNKSSLNYEAHVQVLDSTSEGYTLQWQYKNFNSEDNPSLSMVNLLLEELKIIYTTTTSGAFKDLTNWKEVRDFYVATFEMSFKGNKDDTAKAVKDKILSMFQTKEQVEALLIREVQIYHTPYGFEYAKEERKGATELNNVFGGDPFPAIQTIQAPDINPKGKYFTVHMNTEIDKGVAGGFAQDVLKKLMPFPSSSDAEVLKALAELQLKESSEFRVDLSTGWLSKALYKKEVKNGDTIQVETYLIEEKK